MPTGALQSARLFVTAVTALILLFLTGVTDADAAKKRRKSSTAPDRTKAASRKAMPAPAAAQTPGPAPASDWSSYLDVAHELTFWEKGEIREWRLERERELGLPLATYIAQARARLVSPAQDPDTAPFGSRPVIQRDKEYLRLAIALILEYLQEGASDDLSGAARQLEILQGKTSMPEIAYWTAYTSALQAVEDKDSARLVTQAYDIWNNAAKFMEQAEQTAAGDAPRERRVAFYNRNLVNLVVNRAIIEHRLADLNALGPLFLMLGQRDFEERDGEGLYFTTLVKRIGEGLTAPDSDRYRLNFTVAAIEAKRLQQLATARMDAEGMTPAVQQLFQRVRIYNDLAMQWAESRRSSGAVNIITDSLDLTSFAIQRLADNEQAPAFGYFAMYPGHDGSLTVFKAMAMFNDLAPLTEEGWERPGYVTQELCLKAAHRLWRSIMELSLWTGDYYLGKLSRAGQQQIFDLAIPMQVSLASYLDFLDSQRSRGFARSIPDSAWFGASEAAEKLAFAYQKTAPYTSDNSSYNLWFLYRLQAAELFPFDAAEISRTAAILRREGRFDLFLDYYIPLGARLKASEAVKAWLESEKGEAGTVVRDYLKEGSRIFSASAGTEPATSPARLRQLREELQRKPDHPLHRLLRTFYEEELARDIPFTRLLKNSGRLNP